MPYNWAQLAFVEKWRLHAVRGHLIGMYRPEDRTFFDLRLRPGEGGVGRIPGVVELHMVDAGDIIREKRLTLTSTVAVVVRVVAAAVSPSPAAPAPASGGRGRRWLEPNTTVDGTVHHQEEDVLLADIGMPVLVQLPDQPLAPAFKPGQAIRITIAETPKGFLVV